MDLIVVITGLIGIIESQGDYYLLVPNIPQHMDSHELRIVNPEPKTADWVVHKGLDLSISGRATKRSAPYLPLHSDLGLVPKYSWVREHAILRLRNYFSNQERYSIDHLMAENLPKGLKARIKIPQPKIFGYTHHGTSKDSFCSLAHFTNGQNKLEQKVFFSEYIVFMIHVEAERGGYLLSAKGQQPIEIRDNGEGLGIVFIEHLPTKICSSCETNHRHENALFNLFVDSSGNSPPQNSRLYPQKNYCGQHESVQEITYNPIINLVAKAFEMRFSQNPLRQRLFKSDISRLVDNRLACPPYILNEDP